MTSPIRCASAGLSWLFFLTCLGGFAIAEPIGWMERFALSADREKTLEELTPGTDEYYFFHCLHYQNTEQFERAEAILQAWLAEHDGRETPVIQSFSDRQRLLTYAQTPDRTVEYLIRRLGVELNHGPPPSQGERRFPSQLEAALLEPQAVLVQSLQTNVGLRPRGVAFLAEEFLAGRSAEYPIQLAELLNRVEHATSDKWVALVIEELKQRPENRQSFGELAAHRVLTLKELQQVATEVPAVADDQNFVTAMIQRLRLDADSDPSQQFEKRREYLQRLEQYTQTLPPSYHSLKASAAYRLLEANLSAGVYDRELLMRYLALPRLSPLVSEEVNQRSAAKARLDEDFFSIAMLPPIGDEQTLVRAYLEHFLRDAKDFEAFRELLRPEYLRRVFAETKLLAGIGDADRWYKMLTAAERQTLVDAVQLRLAADNPESFAVDAPVSLKVSLKNIESLVVRIYEINGESYYRNHTDRIDTDIELDGLVPTHERQLTYHYPAVRRHEELIPLPEITDRGVWIVDLVGEGLRARALVRCGTIESVQTRSADGVVLTIIDENRKPIPGATLQIASKRFTADSNGQIAIPPVAEQLQTRGVISDGQLAQPIEVLGLLEDYELEAAMELDRTQLQPGQMAEVLVRPRLRIGDVPIDSAMLTDVVAVIESVDRDGVASRSSVEQIVLHQDRELVVPFRVPVRLSQMTVTLRGSIRRHADGETREVSTSTQWRIGQTQATNQPHDAFLTRDGEAFVIEVRGRSGEPITGAPVTVQVETLWSQQPIPATLQTDEAGRVGLGQLESATRVTYGVASGVQHAKTLPLEQTHWPSRIHTTSELGFSLPLAGQEELTQRYRLLAWRDGAPHSDVSSHLASEGGRLVVDALAAGDYRLIDRHTGASTEIVVVAGPVIDAVGVGQVRHVQLSPQRPLGIESIVRDENGLSVKVSGDLRLARVHVFASRFLEPRGPAQQLQLAPPSLRSRRVTLHDSGYVSDLRLGDEYQYVLRRRFAEKFPGVMLPQPSLLLNPWETEETENKQQVASEGEAPSPSATSPKEAPATASADRDGIAPEETPADYSFLADRSVVLANLQPAADGRLHVPADEIDGLPIVQVLLVDPVTLVHRVVATELVDLKTLDRRLTAALDTKTPYKLERRVTVASKERPLDLSSLGSGQLQVYASAAQFFELQRTLLNDQRMTEFAELMKWPSLDREEKLAVYGRLASHETHLLLWTYDRPFFDEVIRPYLENKKEKDFIDDWLLERPLHQYGELWRYQSLNAAEKALLGLRVEGLRAAIERELREHVELRQVDELELRRVIDSAIAGEQLQDLPKLSATLSAAEPARMNLFGAAGDGLALEMADAADTGVADVRRLNRGEPVAEEKLWSFRYRRLDALSRSLDTTKQWAESQWDRVRTVDRPKLPSLVAENAYWLDLVRHGRDRSHVSSHLLEAIENRHAAMAALAFSGLPLQPPDVQLPDQDATEFAPDSAVLVVSKHLTLLEAKAAEDRVLVGQRFQLLDQPSPARDQAVEEPSEFLVGVPYQGQLVISNLTGQKQAIEVFWQIPAGSIALAGGRATDSQPVQLEPFAVHSIQYTFYFPASGEFVHYPATVSANGELLSRGSEKSFRVLDEPSQLDPQSWAQVARRGTPEQIAAFLREANLRELDWSRVFHRLNERSAYEAVIESLRQQQFFVPEIYAYALKHRDETTLQDWLSLHKPLIASVGPRLLSPLLVVDPIERHTFEHLEYAPLVQPRIHRLGDENEIFNPQFLAHYREFLKIASYRDALSVNERLATVYYLLLQNRIAEAIEWFGSVDADTVGVRLQYDYLSAYLAMHQADFARAGELASQYHDYPVYRWRERFQLLTRQIGGEVASVGDGESQQIVDAGSDLALLDRERDQAAHANAESFVGIRVDGDQIKIEHRRATEATLHFYGVDLELLFSKAPFVRDDLQRMSMVRPIRSETVPLGSPDGETSYRLDPQLRRQTLLIEVEAGSSRSTALSYGGEISTYVSEGYGQLQVTDRTTRDAVPTAYVKVYARFEDGSVRFYKDGYTDSRGRFDYASVSGPDGSAAKRFAILVLDEKLGATLHDVAAPNQ